MPMSVFSIIFLYVFLTYSAYSSYNLPTAMNHKLFLYKYRYKFFLYFFLFCGLDFTNAN